jgi:hypothetical protein
MGEPLQQHEALLCLLQLSAVAAPAYAYQTWPKHGTRMQDHEAQVVTVRRLPRCRATLTGSSIKEGDLLMLARKGGAAEGAPPQSHPMAVDREGNPLNPQVHHSGLPPALRSAPYSTVIAARTPACAVGTAAALRLMLMLGCRRQCWRRFDPARRSCRSWPAATRRCTRQSGARPRSTRQALCRRRPRHQRRVQYDTSCVL